MRQRTLYALMVLLVLGPSSSQDIFELTTRLDDPRVRFLFHRFRNFVFNSIGKTGQKTKGKFLQEKFPDNAPFPCNVSIGKSKVRPSSIHKLRPGGNLFWPDTFFFTSLLFDIYSNALQSYVYEINAHLCALRSNQLITYFSSCFYKKCTLHIIVLSFKPVINLSREHSLSPSWNLGFEFSD
jgi:hypothetical protein